jgi:hypothetical protein
MCRFNNTAAQAAPDPEGVEGQFALNELPAALAWLDASEATDDLPWQLDDVDTKQVALKQQDDAMMTGAASRVLGSRLLGLAHQDPALAYQIKWQHQPRSGRRPPTTRAGNCLYRVHRFE